MRVEGSLGSELGRLTNAVVALYGTVSGDGPTRTIEANAYEVVSIDGRRPLVGVLRRIDGRLVLEQSSGTVTLGGSTEPLGEYLGGKVYVLGSVEDGTFVVDSYGVIRAP